MYFISPLKYFLPWVMIWVMDSIPWVRCASGNVYILYLCILRQFWKCNGWWIRWQSNAMEVNSGLTSTSSNKFGARVTTPDLWLFYWDHMKLGSKKRQMPLLNPQNLLKSFSGFSVASWTQRQSIVGMANWALLDKGNSFVLNVREPPHTHPLTTRSCKAF